MPIRIFITGGTFDKEYNELNGELFFKDTHLHEMLRLGRSKLTLDITTLMMIDSLDMTDADRERISHECIHAAEERILITHGTDTMATTASVLAEKVKDKTIVITFLISLAAQMGCSTLAVPWPLCKPFLMVCILP